MVMVKQPLLSGWASGSIFKTITFRALFNQRFCVHRFRHTQKRRSAAQLFYQNVLTEKMRLYRNWVAVAKLNNSLFGKGHVGGAMFNSGEGLGEYLDRIPPLNIEG